MMVNAFSSVEETSRRVQILLPISFPSDLMTLASFSMSFAKDFTFTSTDFLAGDFLADFFVGIAYYVKV